MTFGEITLWALYVIISISIFLGILYYRIIERQFEYGVYRLTGDILYSIIAIIASVFWPVVIFVAGALLVTSLPILIPYSLIRLGSYLRNKK